MFKIKMDDYLIVIEKLNSINSLLCENKTKKVSSVIADVDKIVFSISQLLDNDDFESAESDNNNTCNNNDSSCKSISLELQNLKSMFKINNDLMFNKIAAIELTLSENNNSHQMIPPKTSSVTNLAQTQTSSLTSIPHFKKADPLTSTCTPDKSSQKPTSGLIVQLPNQSKKKFITGTASNVCSIKSIPPPVLKRHFFLSRLDPNTNIADIKSHLTSLEIKFLNVYELKSKYPSSYSSFCIEIEKSEINAIFDPTHWPTGALIMPFYSSKVIQPDNSEITLRNAKNSNPINSQSPNGY